jgi:Predicted membrane protein
MQALSTTDLRHVAVVDLRYGEKLPQPVMLDNTAQRSISVSKYTPRQVVYNISASSPGVAVLSDIYYPYGWHATIDGKEIPIARANYVLRAVSLPAGDYQLSLTFAPRSITITEGIAFTALALILLALVGSILWRVRSFVKTKESASDPSQAN